MSWEKAGILCPYCGNESVWFDLGHDDFYLGPIHACGNEVCGSFFYFLLTEKGSFSKPPSEDTKDEQT